MEPDRQMETRTKICGPIPGGFILTHTQKDLGGFCFGFATDQLTASIGPGHCPPALAHALVEDVFTEWRSVSGHVAPLFRFLQAGVPGITGPAGSTCVFCFFGI